MFTYSYNGNTTVHRQRKGRYWSEPRQERYGVCRRSTYGQRRWSFHW